MGRVFVACLLLFAGRLILYVWCRLNPRIYTGDVAPRLGLLVSGGAIDVLEGNAY